MKLNLENPCLNNLIRINSRLLLCLLISILPELNFAQCTNLRGSLFNNVGDTLYSGVVQILDTDSSILSFKIVNSKGQFSFSNVRDQKIILKSSYLGHQVFIQRIDLCKDSVLRISLQKKDLNLTPFEVVAKELGLKVDGDTLRYSLESFANGKESNLQELIDKLPGFNIDNGEVYFKGKKVKELQIDQKDILKGKQHIILNDLRPDLFEDIEVYHNQNSAFSSGVDQDDMIVNLQLKAENRDTWVGGFNAAIGYELKYEAGVQLLKSSGKSAQLAIVKATNTGQRLVSITDYFNLQPDFSFLNSSDFNPNNPQDFIPQAIAPPSKSRASYDQLFTYSLDNAAKANNRNQLSILVLYSNRYSEGSFIQNYQSGELVTGNISGNQKLGFGNIFFTKTMKNFRFKTNVQVDGQSNQTRQHGLFEFSEVDSKNTLNNIYPNLNQSIRFKRTLTEKTRVDLVNDIGYKQNSNVKTFDPFDTTAFFQNTSNETVLNQFASHLIRQTHRNKLTFRYENLYQKHNLSYSSDYFSSETDGVQTESICNNTLALKHEFELRKFHFTNEYKGVLVNSTVDFQKRQFYLNSISSRVKYEKSVFAGCFITYKYNESIFYLSNLTHLFSLQRAYLANSGDFSIFNKFKTTQSIAFNLYKFSVGKKEQIYINSEYALQKNPLAYTSSIRNNLLTISPIIVPENKRLNFGVRYKMYSQLLRTSFNLNTNATISKGLNRKNLEEIQVNQTSVISQFDTKTDCAEDLKVMASFGYTFNEQQIKNTITQFNNFIIGSGLEWKKDRYNFRASVNRLLQNSSFSNNRIWDLKILAEKKTKKGSIIFIKGDNILNLSGLKSVQSNFNAQYLEINSYQLIGGQILLGFKAYW